jgi:hypothetical protein
VSQGQSAIENYQYHSLLQKSETYVGAWRIHRRTHSIGKKVILPTEPLHHKHTQECVNRGFLEDLMIIDSLGLRGGRKSVVGTGSRDEVFIFF